MTRNYETTGNINIPQRVLEQHFISLTQAYLYSSILVTHQSCPDIGFNIEQIAKKISHVRLCCIVKINVKLFASHFHAKPSHRKSFTSVINLTTKYADFIQFAI
jgi:hypothetical protein